MNRPNGDGADYYYALRRIAGARRTGLSEEYVAAMCREAQKVREEYGPWPSGRPSVSSS